MEEARSAYAQETQEAMDLAGKYLTFELGQEEYGIGILKIKEIIGMMPITAVPQTPSFIKGVINLRGKVIPVTDLRMKFGLETRDYHERTCIIVVEVDCGSQELVMGLVVDAVSEVANIRGGEIEEAPNFGSGNHAGFVKGMAKIAGGVKILLDIDCILTGEQLSCLADMH
ncbi:MAG: chemotaxis protein CheW [Syntrophales bacterium]|nr:chemotaxis protein CheW [Syntrophales bacterium]MDD5640235.1 chemotaxis protein CheW [Syntrophales bacterium]